MMLPISDSNHMRTQLAITLVAKLPFHCTPQLQSVLATHQVNKR